MEVEGGFRHHKSAVSKGQASSAMYPPGKTLLAVSKTGRMVTSTCSLFPLPELTACRDPRLEGRSVPQKEKKKSRSGKELARLLAGSLSPRAVRAGSASDELRDGVGVLGHSLLLASSLQRHS